MNSACALHERMRVIYIIIYRRIKSPLLKIIISKLKPGSVVHLHIHDCLL